MPTHHLCVSWKDYLPLEKQVRLTNMVVPQNFNEKCGIQTRQKLEIYKGLWGIMSLLRKMPFRYCWENFSSRNICLDPQDFSIINLTMVLTCNKPKQIPMIEESLVLFFTNLM